MLKGDNTFLVQDCQIVFDFPCLDRLLINVTVKEGNYVYPFAFYFVFKKFR